jgi:hypothetical protein
MTAAGGIIRMMSGKTRSACTTNGHAARQTYLGPFAGCGGESEN